MKITSAKFVKGVGGTDPIFDDHKPQIAFIGRSNVGKSSLINSLTGVKDLAITSSSPGRTQEINLFLINGNTYFVDLPGYGFAKAPQKVRERLQQIIRWYFFESACVQKIVVLIIDAEVGVTALDREMLAAFEEHHKNVIIVANKIDKVPQSTYVRSLRAIHEAVGTYPIIEYSSESEIGHKELRDAII